MKHFNFCLKDGAHVIKEGSLYYFVILRIYFPMVALVSPHGDLIGLKISFHRRTEEVTELKYHIR
jgi:hypothetical protein